jgi:hypothetical protein
MALAAYIVRTPERQGFFVSVVLRMSPQGLAPATGAPGLHNFAVRKTAFVREKSRFAVLRPPHPAAHVS